VDTGPHVLPVPGVLDGWCREGLRVVFGCFQDEEKSRRRHPDRRQRSHSAVEAASPAGVDRGPGGRFLSTGRCRSPQGRRSRSRRGHAVAVAARAGRHRKHWTAITADPSVQCRAFPSNALTSHHSGRRSQCV